MWCFLEASKLSKHAKRKTLQVEDVKLASFLMDEAVVQKELHDVQKQALVKIKAEDEKKRKRKAECLPMWADLFLSFLAGPFFTIATSFALCHVYTKFCHDGTTFSYVDHPSAQAFCGIRSGEEDKAGSGRCWGAGGRQRWAKLGTLKAFLRWGECWGPAGTTCGRTFCLGVNIKSAGFEHQTATESAAMWLCALQRVWDAPSTVWTTRSKCVLPSEKMPSNSRKFSVQRSVWPVGSQRFVTGLSSLTVQSSEQQTCSFSFPHSCPCYVPTPLHTECYRPCIAEAQESFRGRVVARQSCDYWHCPSCFQLAQQVKWYLYEIVTHASHSWHEDNVFSRNSLCLTLLVSQVK